jgi:hypothetical protein
MNWTTRNLIVVALGAATSLITIAVCLYLEAIDGRTVFGINGQTFTGGPMLAYIPVGALVAGFLSSLGYLAGSLMLRNRPAILTLVAILTLSVGMVYTVQSAEVEYYAGARGTTKNLKTFALFMVHSATHSRLRLWTEQGTETAAAMATLFLPSSPSTTGTPLHPGSTAGGKADPDAGAAPAKDASQLDPTGLTQSMDAINAHIRVLRGEWTIMALQALCYTLGPVLVYLHFHSLPYCKDCMLLLSNKGERTRYFSRTKELHSAADSVLIKAREKHYRESIQAHLNKGAERRADWAEFSSTLQIRSCARCQVHVLDFHASRKKGSKWNEIPVLAFSGSTLDPLDFA